MMTDQDLEKMEARLSGRLDEKALREFEQRLQTDPEWRSQWALFQQMISGIQVAGQQNLRQSIRAASERGRKRRDGATRRFWWGLGLAASIGLLLVVGLLIPGLQQRQWSQLESEYYDNPRQLLLQTLDELESSGFAGKQLQADTPLARGLKALEARRYAEATRLLGQAGQTDPAIQATAHLFLGISYLEQGAYAKAIRAWQDLPAGAPAWVAQEARYQSAWTWAKRPFGARQAKRLLNAIAGDPADPHQASAARLLRQLE